VPKSSLNPKVDVYIEKAAPFAQPILTHIRAMVHKVSPEIEEQIKWNHPFFVHRGKVLGNMAAFKAHCSFGFWGAEMTKILTDNGVLQDGGMGSLGRITNLDDLPPAKQLLGYLRQAVSFIDSGHGDNRFTMARRVAKAASRTRKSVPKAPPEFTAALKKSKSATTAYAAFSPSCKREYIQWITEARRPETRDRRIAQAIAQIAEGKQRNWKYQDC
jgi:uncharacterized protein YdeI (YjbR/CyaY-like superfamily)